MKTFITLMVTGLILLSISSCSPSETDNTHIYSIIEDRTEHHFKMRPQSQNILNHMNIEKDLWGSTTFRYTTVSEIDYNQHREVQLLAENKYTGNSYLRKRKVQDFNAEIEEILQNPSDSIEQTQSSIFLPIIRELDHLSKMDGTTKELIVFSDLKENDSQWFSFYSSSNLETLEQEREKVTELFLSKIPKEATFNNVALTVIYEPLDAKDNQEFRLMVLLYKDIFQKLNVPITFSANL